MIGGCNRSGTTILNLIIANDPRGMALGEIGNLFKPHLKEHAIKLQELEKDPIWKQILAGGPKMLCKNLIKFFPEIDYFVDSTKLPEWYQFQMNNNPGLDFKNIVSFKHPEDQLKSLLKRYSTANWERIIENYHQRYFYTLPDFRSISLPALLKTKSSLKVLCDYLEMPYSEDKLEYWNRTHPNFFGSDTIKKATIDRSGIMDINTVEDIKQSSITLSPTIINIYSFLLDRAISLEQPKQKFYNIAWWKKSYISLRNLFAVMILRTKYLFLLKKT